MKRYAKVTAHTLILLLVAFVFLASGVAQAGRYEGTQASAGWSGGLAQSPDQDSPATTGTIWGPDVGPEPTGESFKLAPLAISEEQLAANASIVSDDFNTCALDTDIWTYLDPRGDSQQQMTGTFTDDAWLELSLPADADHDIWVDGNYSARVMQPADDVNFEVEVKFESGVNQQYQMQGILVEQDSENFLRFEFYGDGLNTRFFVVLFEPGVVDPLAATVLRHVAIGSTNVAPLYMNVRRVADQWIVYYSFDGTNWLPGADFNLTDYGKTLSVSAVGTYAANAGPTPPAFTAKIDYFFNMASPISPEDGARNTLTITPDGQGTVTRVPNKGEYNCSEVVALTPNPSPGWGFGGWSGPDTGDLVDNQDGTWSLTMDGPKELTATFTEDVLTLTVGVVGNGAVLKDPDQATYSYNQVVKLTPNPDPGWVFDHWEGPDAGDPVDNQDGTWSLTMNASKELSAVFAQEENTLTIDTIGQGTVIQTPAPPYTPGITVTLTPDPAAGWSFDSWSGPDAADLVDNQDGTWSLLMDEDKALTARFRVAQYTLTITVVGEGKVFEAPPGPYLYGEPVTLTPRPNPGWVFEGWSGPDGDDPVDNQDGTWSLTMDADKEVTADFVKYRIYLPFVVRSY